LPGSDTQVKDYGSVANRLTAIQMGDDLPVAHLSVRSVKIKISTETFITFQKSLDTAGMFNGADITLPVAGWWSITADCYWDKNTNGYRMLLLDTGGGTEITSDQRPTDNWTLRATRNTLAWQGHLAKATRLRIKLHQNSDKVLTANSVDFRVSLIRRLPDNLYD
jgi:hypothetical protein